MDITTKHEKQLNALLNWMTPEMIGMDLDDSSEGGINITEAAKIFELFQLAVGVDSQHNVGLKSHLRQDNLIDSYNRFNDKEFANYIKSKIFEPEFMEQGLRDDDDTFASFCRILLPILQGISNAYENILDPCILEGSNAGYESDDEYDAVEPTSPLDDMECILPGASQEIFIDEETLQPEVLSCIII